MSDIESTIISKIDFEEEDLDFKRLAVLIVLRGRQMGRRCLLNAETLICGRTKNKSDITFSNDPGISSEHCSFVWNAERNTYMANDLKSLNGTYVNGHRIESKDLADGDKIFIGNTVLKYTYHDVIEAEFHREMEKRINIDDLTGLVIKRKFDVSFRKALQQAIAQDKNLTVLMMDIDDLKAINDTHGHLLGAYCISKIGRLVKNLTTDKGLATRFGGDEFTAYLIDTDKKAAVDWADTLRDSILNFSFEKDEIRVYPTISIGVATFPEDGQSADALIRKADEALYRAKASGRNNVCE